MRKFLTWGVFVFCAILVSAWALYGIWDFDLAMANKANGAGSMPTNPSAKSDICGDVDDSYYIEAGDIMYLINYLFGGGDTLLCSPNTACGDVNGDGWVDAGDLQYLMIYYYGGGSEPIGYPGMCSSPYPDTSDLDTGVRDSLRVVTVEAAPGEDVGIPIMGYNDDSLSGFVVAVIVPEGGCIDIDSVSWIGSRAEHLANPGVITPDSALIYAVALTAQPIPPGSGLLATVWGHVEPPGPPDGEVTLKIVDWDPGRSPRFYTKTEHFWGYEPWYTEFPLDTIRYDDGTPVYSLEYNYGDTVLVWFNPDSVCTLKSVQFLFEDSGEIIFHVWKDPPDSTGELLDDDLIEPQPFYVTTNDSTSWTTIDLTPFNIAVEDERGIYIGYELTGTAPYPRILSDSSEADTLHSFCFTTGDEGKGWYPVEMDTETFDLISQLEIEYTGEPFDTSDMMLDMDEGTRWEADCETDVGRAEGRKFAVLIGCDWAVCCGDIRFAFHNFIKHGYKDVADDKKDEIWVAYDDGTASYCSNFDGEGAANDIDGSAKHNSIDAIFTNWLDKKTLTQDDQVFIYIRAHGARDQDDGRKKGGILGWKAWFGTADNKYTKEHRYYDWQLEKKVSKLACGTVILVVQFCHCGHFAEVLGAKKNGPHRVVLAACLGKQKPCSFQMKGVDPEYGPTWFYYGEFALAFDAAVCGYQPNFKKYPGKHKGKIHKADTKKKDNAISMEEAFAYAKDKYDDWDDKDGNTLEPQYKETQAGLGAMVFLWDDPGWVKALRKKQKEKRKKKNKGIDDFTEVGYEYFVDVTNTSTLPIQKIVKTIAAEDLDPDAELLVNRPFVGPPIHWEAAVVDSPNGDKLLIWNLKEPYQDEWGLVAFGDGRLAFPYWYDTDTLIGVPQLHQFYSGYDDSLTYSFADTIIASGESTPEVGINECMPNPVFGNDEWIELYNWGETSVDLTGWLIAHKDSILADSLYIIEMIPSFIIPSNGYYYIQLSGENLLNHRDVLYLLDADSSIVDVVHWDQDNSYEGAAPEGYSLVCDLDGCADSWEWDPNPSPDYSNINPDIEVIALEHQIANAGEDVVVDFYVWNTSAVLDSSWISVSDSLGWTLNPTQLELTLAPDEDSIVSITVTIPTEKALGRIDWITATATSQSNPSLTDQASLSITAVGLAPFVRGDVTVDGVIDLGDVLYIISYLYKGGTAPDPLWTGDCNCDGLVDLGDVLYLISYLYKGGLAPGC